MNKVTAPRSGPPPFYGVLLVLSFSLSLSAVALHGQMMGDHPLPTEWAEHSVIAGRTNSLPSGLPTKKPLGKIHHAIYIQLRH